MIEKRQKWAESIQNKKEKRKEYMENMPQQYGKYKLKMGCRQREKNRGG
mgnify:CR=1 FL=1